MPKQWRKVEEVEKVESCEECSSPLITIHEDSNISAWAKCEDCGHEAHLEFLEPYVPELHSHYSSKARWKKTTVVKGKCNKCGKLLDKDNIFYISDGNPPTKTICYDCHTDYGIMRQTLYTNGKRYDEQETMKAIKEWLNA